MDLTTLDWQWYVPALHGNRDEPEPCMVELKTPAYGYVRSTVARRAGASAEKRSDIDRAGFIAHVRGVRNLTLDGHAVTSGAELWRLGVDENRIAPDLFLEIFQALDDQAKLREGLAAGLSGPSGLA